MRRENVMRFNYPALLLATLIFCLGCGGAVHEFRADESPEPRPVPVSGLPVAIDTDRGRLSVERDYIPGVVACEIGRRTWGVPAMEAQAIAARTYLARYLERTKGQRVIPIGPRFQCWKQTRDPRFREVAASTAGLVLRYNGSLITGNYVSGTHKLTAGCDPEPPTAVKYTSPDWSEMLVRYKQGRREKGRTIFKGTAWTEIFVTRNEGKQGPQVAPSPIAGAVSFNRGALGQNAAVCLANNMGYETSDILKYFYGEDIVVESY